MWGLDQGGWGGGEEMQVFLFERRVGLIPSSRAEPSHEIGQGQEVPSGPPLGSGDHDADHLEVAS